MIPDIMTIPLRGDKFAVVDGDDYEWLSQWHWGTTGAFQTGKNRRRKKRSVYARTTQDGNEVYMHRLILQLKKGELCDHINRDTLDNRRENLRKATKSQNNQNAKRLEKNTSGYKGVYWAKDRDCWRARITLNLGSFTTPEEAARAYDRTAIERHGEFAALNFPRSDYEH